MSTIRQHVAGGYKEIALTGTQLGTYGFDLAGTNLVGLLTRILKETDVPRLRVSSLQAHEISPELLNLWEDVRLCPHFHVPLQSGSDVILKAMRRRYNTNQFRAGVDLIRATVPDASITTDIIVGFPGEDTSAHAESLAFARGYEIRRHPRLPIFASARYHRGSPSPDRYIPTTNAFGSPR